MHYKIHKRSSLILLLSLLATTSLVISGCTNPDGSLNKTNTATLGGVIIGSTVGGYWGSGGALFGGLIGAMIGNSIGQSLTKQDQMYQARTYHQALEYSPSGTISKWHNPDSDVSGAIIPQKTYQEGKRYCREFRQEIMIGNKKEDAHGKACRNPDGTWEIVG